MHIDIDENAKNAQFDFDWIFDHIYKINRRRLRQLQQNYMESDTDQEYAKRQQQLKGNFTFVNVFNKSLAGSTQIPQANLLASASSLGLNDYVNLLNRAYRDRNPQNLANISTYIQMGAAQQTSQAAQTSLGFLRPKQAKVNTQNQKKENEGRRERNYRQTAKIKMIQKYADEIHKLYKRHVGSADEMKRTHGNVLLILDDVIGEITREQHSFQLAKLFLNRRHLIANATISIMVSTQKYTMIPSRIRSNANWNILFSLSPNEFDLVRKDSTSFHRKAWESILKYTFGDQVIDKQGSEIHETNDGAPKDDHTHISIHVDGNVNRLFKNDQEFQIQ